MGKRMTVPQRNAMVLQLHDDGLSQRAIAQHVGIAVSTVNAILKGEQKGHTAEHTERIHKELKKMREVEMANVIDMVQSANFAQLGAKALKILSNDDNLEDEVNKRGIANIYRLFGMITDKVLAVETLKLEHRKMDVREKELDIKLKELELRIQRPEAFHEVHIINDAPKDYHAAAD